MANQQQASSANGGFRVGALSPDEAERFAALFIPTWDLPPEVPTDAPDPGFRAAPSDTFDVALIASPGAAEVPDSTEESAWPSRDSLDRAAAQQAELRKQEAASVVAKKTMMGIAAPVAPEPPLAAPPERAPEKPAEKKTMMGLAEPFVAPVMKAPTAPTPAEVAAPARPLFAPTFDVPSSVDATDSYAAMKKKPPYLLIGGGIAVLAIAGIFFATRGGSDKTETKTEDKSSVVEEKLPDPNAVGPATTAAAATTTAAATTATTVAAATTTVAETKTAPTPTVTATAKAPEPPKPTATAKAPPPPTPKVTAKPKPPPIPKATATAKPAKKPPAVKEDF